MPTTMLTTGPPHTLVQNQTYAMPARLVYLHGQGSGFEVSNDGTTWQAVTLVVGQPFPVAAQFVRSTAVGSIVSLKAR